MRTTGMLVLALLGGAAPVAGQVWDSPFLVPPRPDAGIALHLVDVAGGGSLGFMARWQPTSASWAFRGGIAEAGDDVAVFGGADISGALTRSTDEFPIDIDWVFGLGATLTPDLILSVPVGLTGGHTFQAESATFTPYLTPRVILDAFFDSDTRDELELDFAVDLGLDLSFDRRFTIRFGGTLGDHREAVAIGVVFGR